MLACLLLLLLLLCCLLRAQSITAFAPLPPKIENIWQTEPGLVRRTKARWKDRPIVSGGFFYRYGIPGLEGSDPRKVVQKHPFSPRGRRPLAPGPPLGGISEDLRAAVPNTKFCTRTSLAQDNNRISALFQCPASAKSPSAGSE